MYYPPSQGYVQQGKQANERESADRPFRGRIDQRCPADLGVLAEILTLVQTGKAQCIPIILMFEPFWRGLLEWLRGTLVP